LIYISVNPKAIYQLLAAFSFELSLDIDQFVQDFVTGGNDPGIGLKRARGGNHLYELLGQIDIGHFKRAGTDVSQAAVTGDSRHLLSGRQ
jgi:hypothetical protein